MKHTHIEQVPATTREVVDHYTCDLCKLPITKHGYHRNDVEISHDVGDYYPDGGNGTQTVVDLCGKCFTDRLLPWLKSQGVEPREEDRSW